MPVYSRRGTETNLSPLTAGEQTQASIAGFAAGGFVLVWTTNDATQDGSGRAIKFQRYDAAGVAIGGETLVNTAATLDQRFASVTVLASGNFLVSWETTDTTQDGAGTAIKAQLFSGAGVAIGSEFRVNTNAIGDQTKSSVTALTGGGFVVAWQTSDATQDGNASAIKAQRYDAAGAAVGGEFLVNPTGMGGETLPHVTALASGGFLATWTLGSGTNADIYARVFDANNAKVGAAFRVNSVTALNQDFASAVQLADGRIVVTWASSATTTFGDVDIKAQVFSATGTPIGSEFLVSTTKYHANTTMLMTSSKPQIDDLPDGGFVITWTLSAGNYIASSIRGQFYDAAAERVGGEVVVSTASDRLEGDGDVAVDGAGTLLAVWSSANTSASDNNIRGQYFTAETAPVIQSNGGGEAAAISVGENQTAVTTVAASGSGVVYAIASGADAARFTINSATGALTFATAPNFESSSDSNHDGIYELVVSATKGTLSDVQALAVTVTNVNEGLSFTGSTTTGFLYIENETGPVATVAAVDIDGDTVAYSLAGADAAHFTINATGMLAFADQPDFEAAADAGGDHVYDVTVVATDGSFVITRALTVDLLNWNEAPLISSNGGGDSAALTVAENSSAVTFVTLTDPDGTSSSHSFTLAGADAALFGIQQETGYLYFNQWADFETPGDADGDGVYQVSVSVSDGINPADSQALSITITNVNEAVSITSGSAFAALEGQSAVGTVTASDLDGDAIGFAITGGADAARFALDAVTGELAFLTSPDAEAPGDADGDNVYDVIVTASDGAVSDTRTLSVTVGDLNEAPVIWFAGEPASSSLIVSMSEGYAGVSTLLAVDPEGDAIDYVLAGVDAALFAFDGDTGELRFVTAPDFETPGSALGTNSYDVTLVASDGALDDAVDVTIHIGNVNEPVTITSMGGGDTAAVSVTEGDSTVGTIAASDTDGDALGYAIIGGADAALFTLDWQSGALAFLAAPDFEAPGDADGDGLYEVIVAASDGGLADSQALAITVTNINEGVTITSFGGGDTASMTMAENTSLVGTVAGADIDGDALDFAILGGGDAARFTIDSETGVLRFVAAPNHEAPGDADGDNVYDLLISASDGSLSDSQMLQVTIANVREGVVIKGNNSANTISSSAGPAGQPRATSLEDLVYGFGGADTIDASAGDDRIDGGAGADKLTGGLGADELIGGTEADRFIYGATSESRVLTADTILDFNAAAGDRIQLTAIDANVTRSSNQAFSFIGTDAFGNVAGELRYEQSGGDLLVMGDVNGDGVADFAIRLSSLDSLAAADFLL